MSFLSNNLDIALDVVKEGASVFTKNISNYNKLVDNLGREVKVEADIQLNKLLIDQIEKRSHFNIISEEMSEIVDKNRFLAIVG